MEATDTLTPWAHLTPRRQREIRAAVATLDQATNLETAAELLSGRFPGNETIADHIVRMKREAAEFIEDAHDRMTPDEYEAFLDANV